MEKMILDKNNLTLKIKEKVKFLKANLNILQDKSSQLMNIVDGKGCERILSIIS